MSLQQPLVSVIMPLFNSEQYVEESIRSILNQRYKNLELIIVNDGSTDASAIISRSFRDDRIRVFDNYRNEGLIASLNKGISLSNGEFIARIDSDDVAIPERLEKQVRYLQEHPDHIMCGSYYTVVDGKGREQYKVGLPSRNKDIKTYLLFGNCFCHSSVMIRTEVLKKYQYCPSYAICEDYDLWMRLSREGLMGNVNEYLTVYRVHGNNISMLKRESMQRCVRLIHGRALQQCGINYTEDELDIHHALLSFDTAACKRYGLDRVERWASQLIEVLGRNRELNKTLMEKVILRRWVTVCYTIGQYDLIVLNRLSRRHKFFYLKALAGKISDKMMNRNSGFDL